MENFRNFVIEEGYELDQNKDGKLSPDALRRMADELEDEQLSPDELRKKLATEPRRDGIYIDKDGIYKDKNLEMTFGEKLRKKMGMQSELDKKREMYRARLASPEGQAREKEKDDIEIDQAEFAAYQAAHGGRTPGQVQGDYEQRKKDQAAYEREKERKRRRQRQKDRYLDSQPKSSGYIDSTGKFVSTGISRDGTGI